jgi:hypothetical protein
MKWKLIPKAYVAEWLITKLQCAIPWEMCMKALMQFTLVTQDQFL